MKPPIRLPLIPASLAALLLLLSACLLLFSVFKESHTVNTRQSSVDLSATVDQLSAVISSESTEWVHGDRLAQLVAVADVQVKQLDKINDGFFARFWPDDKATTVRSVNVDWKLLREGLLSFNQASLERASQKQANEVNTQQTTSVEPQASAASPAIKVSTETESVQNTVPEGFAEQSSVLAESFEVIRENVKDSTRLQTLLDLVETTSSSWVQINDSPYALAELVVQQQSNADELLRLSGAGTQQSLFGYYTSNQIVDYVQSVKSISLTEQLVVGDSTAVEAATEALVTAAPVTAAPVIGDAQRNESAPLSSAFVAQALTPLQESVASLGDLTSTEADHLINWLALAGLLTSFMLLLSAISQMTHAADVLKMRPERQISTAPVVSRGAMSLREADQLIEDINIVADGDLRQPVRLPDNGHARAIAKSTNRSNAVISDLVGMTRGVVANLDELVKRQDQNGRVLADLDIRRQTETAELSDDVGARSAFLDEQGVLLSGSGNVLDELSNRSESAVNGVNQISSSLAAVSAQVDVGVERLQRLMKTAGSVTQATAKLKQLTEKTRLQALNASLKLPQVTQAATHSAIQATTIANGVYDSYEEFSSPGLIGRDSIGVSDTREESSELFDEIHQLTGKLVQVSNETDVLIGALQKDIEDTTTALRQSSEQINESAHHTHSTSLLGKELAGYSDQLRKTIEEALQNLQVQQNNLSQTAEQIVRLDKTGNDTSALTLALMQDLAGLQEMSSKLEESVSSFKISGEKPLE